MTEVTPKYILRIAGRDGHIPCEPTKTILHSLIEAGVFLEANCGGRGTCGKCKIQVVQGAVADKEGKRQVDPNNIYQACQVYPLGDVTIVLKSAAASQKGQNEEIVVDGTMPLLKKVVLRPDYPTIENHFSLQEMIQQAMAELTPDGSSLLSIDMLDNTSILRSLNEVVAAKPEQITLTFFNNKLIALEPQDTASWLYGVAFDIGTTTVAGMLVDINTNKVVAVSSQNNPQASMGADVISRIQAAQESAEGLKRLSQLIRQCLNQIIAKLCLAVKVSPNQIYGGTIVGNTTMIQLALEISPSTLVQKPYAVLFKYIAPLNPGELELDINPQGKVAILPNIASFVGSDTTAAILAIDQDVSKDPLLLVDLGTNGEMAIGDSEQLYACSTAAGPAFEGAHIRDGMRAAEGAISNVTITEQGVTLEVIGNTKPEGICGSGLVKAVAELLKAGILHESGRFNKPDGANIPEHLRHYLKKRNGQWEFTLSDDIAITQADVRQLQLAKSSICTGIEFLMKKYGANNQVKVCLAGAFGNYIDIDSALAIGMLPGIRREHVVSAGNAAGTGAVQALLSAEKLQRCVAIARKAQYLELAAHPDFQNRFLANLSFTKSGFR